MKKTIPLILGLLAGSSAHGAVVTFDDLGFGAVNAAATTLSSDAPGAGAVGFSSTTAGSPTRTSTYTITGFDFNGDTNNDTLTFDLIQSASVGNITNDGTAGVGVSANNSTGVNGADVLTISFGNATVALGGGSGDSYIASLVGFTGASIDLRNSPTYSIGDATGLTGTTATFTSTPSFDLETTSGTGNTRLTNVAFSVSVTAVPEPSSAALLGLGGLALILRRRKL